MHMRFIIFLFSMIFISNVAIAQQEPDAQPPELGKEACQHLVAYQPDVNNDAEYKPGVDVNGNPVVEADVAKPVINAPDEYSFPLTVDVAKYIGMQVPDGLLGEFKLGTITLKKDGKLLFNDKPMESDVEIVLKSMCQPTAKKEAKSGEQTH